MLMGASYHKLSVLSGVPQGSVLGPLLFSCYINDIAIAISSDSEINIFADDTALYCIIEIRADHVHLHNNVFSKTLTNLINAAKCKIMFFSIILCVHHLNGIVLDIVSSYKYLGVTLASI